MISEERIKKCFEILRKSSTKTQFETRKAILDRMLYYIRECQNEHDLFTKVVEDFPVFTLVFVDNLNGEPAFLAKWQVEAGEYLDKFPNVWFFVSRRGGKTLMLAAKQMQLSCKHNGWRFLNFAPTKKQDYLFTNITRAFKNNEFLFRVMCGSKPSAVLKESVELENKSNFEYRNVGLQQQGELSRGESANLVAIDEIQTIPKRAYTSVILPILSDNYGEKKLWMIGTPSLLYNPDLDKEWEKWQKCHTDNCSHKWEGMEEVCPDCGSKRRFAAMRVDWLRAAEDGCLNVEQVKDVMAAMTSDEVLMEYEALFPMEGGRFFPRRLLHESFRGYQFVPSPKAGVKYIMSVDWSKFRDKMEIMIGEVNGNTITLANWTEVDPHNVQLTREETVALVKEKFWLFKPEWINTDSTGAQDLFIDMLCTGDKAIPKMRFYKPKPDKDEYGFIFGGQANHDLYQNYKKALESGNFVVPGGSQDDLHDSFRAKWIKEHYEIETTSAKNKGYLVFSKPKNGYDDMVQSCALLAWYMRYLAPVPPLMAMSRFKLKQKYGR